MSESGRLRIGATAATLPVALWCCQVIGGFDDYEVVTPGTTGVGAGGSSSTGGTGGAEMGGGGSGGVVDLCALASVPEADPQAASGGDTEITVAVRSLRLGEKLDIEGGFDLDDRCTCQDLAICDCAPPDCPCAQPSPACDRPSGLSPAADWVACDEPHGVDASSKRLFNRVSIFDDALTSPNLSLSIEAGLWSVLLHIEEYNGQPNDDQVVVSVHAAGPKTSDPCQPALPEWKGNDAWPIDRDSVVSPISCANEPALPKFIDQFGYVVDGQVVAKLNRATIFIVVLGVNVPVRLRDVRLALPLRQDELGVWQVSDGIISGQWGIADVFEAIATFDKVGTAFCNPTNLAFIQNIVCAYGDLRLEGPASDQPCDAISFFAEVDGVQARLGATIDLPLTPPVCPDLAALDCITPYEPP
ncbi:MAG: hypothetical protein R3B72_48260 [Polyangiaceae bacterium]